MTTCYGKQYGIYNNDEPLPGDRIIADSPGIGYTYDPETNAWSLDPEIAKAQLISDAQDALVVTDSVAMRCFKAGVAFPSEWISFVHSLRSIIRQTAGAPTTMPATPAYPAGT